MTIRREHALGTVPTIAQVVREIGDKYRLEVNKHRTVQNAATASITVIGLERMNKLRGQLDALGWGYAYNAEPPRPNCTDYRSVIIVTSF